MESIINNEEKCFLCESTQHLHKHHVWHGTGNRKCAEEDGLFVKLCLYCHKNLHDKGIYDKYLMAIGERAWLKHYNKSIEDFIKRYGKNVL